MENMYTKEEILKNIEKQFEEFGKEYIEFQKIIRNIEKEMYLLNTSKERKKSLEKEIEELKNNSGITRRMIEEINITPNYNLESLIRDYVSVDITVMETKKPYEEYINTFSNDIKDILSIEDIQYIKNLKDNFKRNYDLYKIENNIKTLSKEEFINSEEFTKDVAYYLKLEHENPKNIKKLKIAYQLKEIPKWLNKLKNLEILDLSHNKFSKIENLENLKNLKSLLLNGNQITKIENLENLKNLEILNLGENQISKIENLNNNKKIEFLYLNDNNIEKIDNLNNLINLKELHLYLNQIIKIEGLDNLTKLQYLELGNNEISIIGNLENLNNLSKINLYNNNIEILEGFSLFPEKIFIDIFNNPVKYIKKQPNLQIKLEMFGEKKDLIYQEKLEKNYYKLKNHKMNNNPEELNFGF